MTIAALIAWLITAAGGFALPERWIARGGPHDNAWTAFAVLLPVALLGFVMFARRLAHDRSTSTAPEAAFPVPIVPAHDLFTVITLALVIITALQA